MLRRSAMMLLVAVTVAGCKNYMATSQSRTVGEFTDDVAIQAFVKSRLLRDPDISGLRINVEVHQGVVGLFGRVSSETERTRAVDLARTVKGVKRVEESLTVAQ